MSNIKNIVFDLGGVLIDIDVSKTNDAFAALGINQFQQYYSLSEASPLFEALETGAIEPVTFYNSLRSITNTTIEDIQLQQAWNALLLNWRKKSVLHLQTLAEHFNLYLFSNTNSIHHDAFISYFTEQTGLASFDDLFTGVWYSFDRKIRKPYTSSFELLLQTEHLLPQETVFIDDTLINIEGAKKVGMHTHHLLNDEIIEDLRF